MNNATFSKSVFAVTAVLIAAACANSADVPAGVDTTATDQTAPTPAKVPASTPTTPPPPPPEKKCAPSCKVDSDCTSTCPALAGGVQCCDTKTNTCWGSKTSSCPAPVDTGDAGAPPAY